MGLIYLGLLAFAFFYLEKQHPPGGSRRQVAGKSGTTWFVGALPPDDGNTVKSAVYQTATGNDMILEYRQVTSPTAGVNVGDRFIEFQAPTSLVNVALADFGPFVNQGKAVS